MLILYGLKNCDTCKKALTWCHSLGCSVDFFDFKKQGLPHEKARLWLDTLGVETVINKRGTTWRRLPEDKKSDLSITRAFDLIVENPSLIKRPVIEAGDWLSIGFDPSVKEQITARVNTHL